MRGIVAPGKHEPRADEQGAAVGPAETGRVGIVVLGPGAEAVDPDAAPVGIGRGGKQQGQQAQCDYETEHGIGSFVPAAQDALRFIYPEILRPPRPQSKPETAPQPAAVPIEVVRPGSFRVVPH